MQIIWSLAALKSSNSIERRCTQHSSLSFSVSRLPPVFTAWTNSFTARRGPPAGSITAVPQAQHCGRAHQPRANCVRVGDNSAELPLPYLVSIIKCNGGRLYTRCIPIAHTASVAGVKGPFATRKLCFLQVLVFPRKRSIQLPPRRKVAAWHDYRLPKLIGH